MRSHVKMTQEKKAVCVIVISGMVFYSSARAVGMDFHEVPFVTRRVEEVFCKIGKLLIRTGGGCDLEVAVQSLMAMPLACGSPSKTWGLAFILSPKRVSSLSQASFVAPHSKWSARSLLVLSAVILNGNFQNQSVMQRS